MSAPTSPALRGLRQPRLPRRPICPPPRSSSKRNRAIQRRPVPVRWSARKDTPSDEVGLIPQASSPPSRQARAPGRSGLPSVGRPAPANGPRRPPPETRTGRGPAALPVRLPPCRRWSPRPWWAGRHVPALPSLAAPRASPCRTDRGRGRGCPIFRTCRSQMQSKQICDKEDAAAAFEAKLGLPSLACKAACVAKAHLDMARYLAPILAMAKTTGPGHDGAGSLLRASGSAILSDRVLDGTSFDAPPGAVTIAAMSDRIEEVRPLGAPPGAATIAASSGSLLRTSGTSFDAPPGAVTIRCIWCNAVSDRVEEIGPRGAPPGAATIAASSGSLLRTSGSSAGASIGTPLCFCSSALCILSKADCAPLPSRVGVRAKGDDTFFIATKERESSSYLCPRVPRPRGGELRACAPSR